VKTWTMLESFFNSHNRLLEPMERISEVLFGLIMVLTVTCSFSIAEADRSRVRDMLFAAIVCNFGLGCHRRSPFLLARFSEQGRGILSLRALRKSNDLSEVRTIIGSVLPPLLASVLTPTDFDLLRKRLNQLPEPPTHHDLPTTIGSLPAKSFYLSFFLHSRS
jgi:hypothetical protein